MASFARIISPFSLCLLFVAISTQFYLPRSLRDSEIELNRPSSLLKQADIHELLPQYGIPKGLIPNNVKSYTLSPDGTFEIELQSTCYVHFDMLVYYDEKIKGKLSYGSVSDVSGIQVKKSFLWVSVSGMKVNKAAGTIRFYVGFLSEVLPAKQFEDIPACRSNACLGESVAAL